MFTMSIRYIGFRNMEDGKAYLRVGRYLSTVMISCPVFPSTLLSLPSLDKRLLVRDVTIHVVLEILHARHVICQALYQKLSYSLLNLFMHFCIHSVSVAGSHTEWREEERARGHLRHDVCSWDESRWLPSPHPPSEKHSKQLWLWALL